MKTRLTTTTASQPLGPERTRRLLEISSGVLAGRRVAVYLSAPDTVSFTWADRPHTSWAAPVILTTTVAGNSFCAALNSTDTLVLAYVDNTSGDLTSVRATWDGSAWQVSPAVTVFTGDVNSDPALVFDSSDTACLSWSRLAAGVRHLHVKSSPDHGATWGAGVTDSGDELHAGGLIAVSTLAVAAGRLYIAYYYDSLLLCVRRKLLPDGEWSDPTVIASGTEASPTFACAVRGDGLLGLAYGVTQVLYREFDGLNLGPAASLYQSPPGSVQLSWNSQYPLIVFTEPSGDNQNRIRITDRAAGEFATPRILDGRNDVYRYFLAYHAAAGTFVDLTSAAQSYDTGDLYHPAGGALLQHYGDALYLGMDLPFRYLHLVLSQAGAGGTVGYSYWNGAQWIAFTPFAGAIALDQPDVTIQFWSDYASIPPDWQRIVVDGRSSFWIRVTVLDAFTTSPVGSTAAAISNITAVGMGRT